MKSLDVDKSQININHDFRSLRVLKFIFWLSLLGVLLSIIVSHLLKRTVFVYDLSYFLLVSFVGLALIQIKKWRSTQLVISNMLLIIYCIFITLPLTLFHGNIYAFLVFIKNSVLFSFLFFYYQKKLNTIDRTVEFMSTLVKGGIFYSVYIYLEFVNKLLNIVPSATEVINSFYMGSRLTGIAQYADSDQFDILTIIRPMGLEISFAAGGFFLSSIFFIVLISGRRFFKSGYQRFLVLILLYFSVFLTTSRQIIFSMHILLFLIAFLSLIFKRIRNMKFWKMTIGVFLIFFLSALLLIKFYPNSDHIDFFANAGGQTGEVLSDDFEEFFSKVDFVFSEYPLAATFGIGGYTPTYPGFYPNLPSPNELHYLFDIPYSMGVVGACIYWYIFIYSIRSCWLSCLNFKYFHEDYTDIFLTCVILGLSVVMCLVHYSPMGLSTIFLFALIPHIANFSRRDLIQKSK